MSQPTRTTPYGIARPAFVFALLLSAEVFIFFGFDALPFMDLPAHAGLIALRHRYFDSPFDQIYFVFAPHLGPYSVFRSLGEVLDAQIGPVSAVRSLGLLPAISTPLAVLWARRRMHGVSHAGFGAMTVAVSFGLMTVFGFASYLFGLSVSIIAFTLWLELVGSDEEAVRNPSGPLRTDARRRRLRAAVFLSCLSPLVFLSHGHAFLIVLFASCASVAAPPRRARRTLLLSVYIPGCAVAAYSAIQERASESSLPTLVSCRASGMHFQGLGDKLSLLLTPTLMTRLGPDVLVGLVIWGAVAVGSVRTLRATWRGQTIADFQSRALAFGVLSLICAFACLPHTIGWFGFVDGRLVLPILLFAIIGLRPDALGDRLSRMIGYVGFAMGALQLTIVLVASSIFQGEARGYLDVLAHVPARARLLNLPIEPNSRVFTGHPFVHYDSLALVDHPVLVSDIWYHQGTAVYPRQGNPAYRLPPNYCESDMESVDWASLRLDDWDFVLIRQRPGDLAPYVPPTLGLVTHQGGWWLWRNASRTLDSG